MRPRRRLSSRAFARARAPSSRVPRARKPFARAAPSSVATHHVRVARRVVERRRARPRPSRCARASFVLPSPRAFAPMGFESRSQRVLRARRVSHARLRATSGGVRRRVDRSRAARSTPRREARIESRSNRRVVDRASRADRPTTADVTPTRDDGDGGDDDGDDATAAATRRGDEDDDARRRRRRDARARRARARRARRRARRRRRRARRRDARRRSSARAREREATGRRVLVVRARAGGRGVVRVVELVGTGVVDARGRRVGAGAAPKRASRPRRWCTFAAARSWERRRR